MMLFLPAIFVYARKYWWLLAIVLALASTLGYITHLQRQLRETLIEKNNAEAAVDKLSVKYANDSAVVVGLLAFTRTELAGLRDKVKNMGTVKAVTKVTMTPKVVHEEHMESECRGLLCETLPQFELIDSVIGPPVNAKAKVAFVIKPDSTLFSKWTWDLEPNSITLDIDVGCVARYKPHVLIGTSPWVRVDSVKTTVKPEVCGVEDKKNRGFWYYALRFGGIAVLYGIGRAHIP